MRSRAEKKTILQAYAWLVTAGLARMGKHEIEWKPRRLGCVDEPFWENSRLSAATSSLLAVILLTLPKIVSNRLGEEPTDLAVCDKWNCLISTEWKIEVSLYVSLTLFPPREVGFEASLKLCKCL